MPPAVRSLRPGGRLLILPLLALWGCTPRQQPRDARGSVDDVLGTYELVSIDAQPLPVRQFQAVYHAGRITLHAGQRYVSEIDTELCSPENVCVRETATAEGTWTMPSGGTLQFHPVGAEDEDPEEDHAPPPRIEVDGREIRIYTPSVALPIFRYARR